MRRSFRDLCSTGRLNKLFPSEIGVLVHLSPRQKSDEASGDNMLPARILPQLPKYIQYWSSDV